MNIDQILRNKVIKQSDERTTYVTIFKSNFLERMDHDFQKILFEIIVKKMITLRIIVTDYDQ